MKIYLVSFSVLCSCNISSTGTDTAKVMFRPLDCGRPYNISNGCTFQDPIAVNGTLKAQIELIRPDGTNLTLEASDATVLKVEEASPVDDKPTWLLTALKDGAIELEAHRIDSRGDVEVDALPVIVTRPQNFHFAIAVGNASGPMAVNCFGDEVCEVWRTSPGNELILQVMPARGDIQLMGKFSYSRYIDNCPGDQSTSDDNANGTLKLQLPRVPSDPDNDYCSSVYDFTPRDTSVYVLQSVVLPPGSALPYPTLKR